MVAWSHLPVEIRNEIVKELDFRTRFRFRHVSKTDQQIVDSVPLNLPRIVLDCESDDKAKLEFYLGINRKIVVDFEKNKKGEAKIRVSGESIDNPIEKLVDCENCALLAFTAFKNVAIHPKTLLNGFEVEIDGMSERTRLRMHRQLEGRKIRTKTLVSKGDWFLMLILPRCSDLLEMQSLENDVKDGIPMHMATWTRKLQVTVENMPIGMPHFMDHLYTIFDDPTAGSLEQLRSMPGRWEYKTHGPNDMSMIGRMGSIHQYSRFSPCGSLTHVTDLKIVNKNPGVCEMRWTCAKHSDPFDYWYIHRTMKPYVTNYSEFIPIRPGMPTTKLYREMIHPIANGVDPVFVMMCGMRMKTTAWEKEMVAKYGEPKVEVPKESKKPEVAEDQKELKVSEEPKESKKPEVARDQKELKVSGEPRKSEGSQPEVVESSDVSDKRELAGSEVAAGQEELKEVPKVESEKALKVSEALESEDSEAEEEAKNPFNTEEFKSKFNKSNESKIDKSWAILMFLSVFSVFFAFFYTFF